MSTSMPRRHHFKHLVTFLAAMASLLFNATLHAVPSTQPVAPSTQSAAPATQPGALLRGPRTPAVEKHIADLTRKAIALLEAHNAKAAEPLLLEALSLDPDHVTNLYNYACLLALDGRNNAALDYLERAGNAGWTDFIHLNRDPDLQGIRDLPRYKQFVANKAAYQKHAAERALADLKKQFGDHYLYDLDEERKLIFATNVDQTTLAELKHWLQAQANSQWNDLFEHRPDEFVSVVVPSPADYKKIVQMPGVGGFYNDGAKLLIVQRLGQVMTHEFTHALHAGDRAPLGQEHPIWIAEGLASLYEAAEFQQEKLVPRDNFRLNLLQVAARTKRLIPLEKLLKMQQGEFVKRANLAYGEAGSILLYLYEEKLLRPFYDNYKKTFDEDPTGKLALEKVYGKKLGDFEQDWVTWMNRRTPIPTNTGPEGVVIGARLGDGNDGIAVNELAPDGPAEKAGLHAGDVIVGIGDMQIRDYQSFIPTLSQHKPGDQVTLKIRRDGKYIELPVTFARRSDLKWDPNAKRPASRPAAKE